MANRAVGSERHGSRKGKPNKATQQVRDALNQCYEDLGGVAGMVKWAKKSDANRTEFYKLWVKQLPHQLNLAGANGKELFAAFAQAVTKDSKA